MLLGPYTWGFCPIPRQRGLFVKSPLWNPEKQRLTFIVWFFIVCSQGIKRPAYMPPTRLRLQAAISCIHGAPPQTPPKGTFCKKSPLESRKTTFDFYCLVFHRLLSRYRKTGVHAADFWFIILFEMYRSYLHWSLMDCKIGITLKAILSPCAFFGVLRTFFAWIVKWSATRRRR